MVRRALAACLLVSCAQSGSILALSSGSDAGDDAGDASGEEAPDTAPAEAGADAVAGGDGSLAMEGPESSATPRAIVLVDTTAPSHVDDPKLEARLGTLGFQVEELAYTSPVSPSAASLVVISSSVVTAGLDPGLATLPTPIVVLEAFSYSALGMTGPVQDQNFGVADETAINVVDSALAGLPLGSITVYTQPEAVNFAQPAAAAVVAAQVPGTSQAATFGYAAGSMMTTQTAPARRAGVFLRTGVIDEATPEAWVMFDTMVRWATQ
jgi:hypothetical protein